jgi:hypothetical protein
MSSDRDSESRLSAVCPGCGVPGLADDPGPARQGNVSGECWRIYGEVAGFGLDNSAELGRFHQLGVDTYGTQHAADHDRSIRVAYSIVGLYLSIERGWSGDDVRRAHQRMGKPQPSWPEFRRPDELGGVTVLDVAMAGVRAGSVVGHAEAAQRWARYVWDAWSAQHAEVASLASSTLAANPPRPL